MICLFLAILEMVKLQAVSLVQADEFGDIAIKRAELFDQMPEDQQTLANLEEEYS